MYDMITVDIYDGTGNSTLVLSPAETADLVQQHQHKGDWVFADNQMVLSDQMTEADYSNVSSVRIVNGFVGG